MKDSVIKAGSWNVEGWLRELQVYQYMEKGGKPGVQMSQLERHVRTKR